MVRQSLLEYFRPHSRPLRETAVTWRRGYRMVHWSFADLYRASVRFAGELETYGIAKGDRVLLWGENSGEWMAAFWGCMLCGAIAVPIDAIGDKQFAQRVAQQAGVRLAAVGRNMPTSSLAPVTFFLDALGEMKSSEGANRKSLEKYSQAQAGRNEPVEIVFTSGTTAEPRGVVITHGNVLANLEPLEREINRYKSRYRFYERLVRPLRFLDLLPLSHVFGQLLGIFLPQIVGATSVFLNTLNPAEVVRAIHDERVSVLVTVPRVVESLRDQVVRDLTSAGKIGAFHKRFRAAEGDHFLERWWRFRAIRRQFGWRFLAIISGGAALPAAAEKFWTRLGYAVIQGYGLTETTSLVSVNHPFHIGSGSIGKSLPGREVKLSEEGEILVRGESVASGYWSARTVGRGSSANITPVLDYDGWFHTGDLGQLDAQGNLYFKGRSKNVIVTPEGLNVFPQDLEAELRKEEGVRDCVVVGLQRDGNEEPCAVLLLSDSLRDSERSARALVEHVNQRLVPFQRMRHWMVWPAKDFPRTPTQKPVLARVREVAEAKLNGDKSSNSRATKSPLADIFTRISHGRSLPESGTAALQLSSIERVELLSALEDRYQTDLSEVEFTSADSVSAIERLLEQPSTRGTNFHFPRWPQGRIARAIRSVISELLMRPIMRFLGWPAIKGRESLRGTSGPVLLIANHVTYFDPVYLLEALPRSLGRRVAIAMDGEFLESMRNPSPQMGFFNNVAYRAAYWLLLTLFNVFPLPRRAGFRKSFAFAGDLVDRGASVLVFPEGERTKDGQMGAFRPGIGLLATRLGVPVVPMRLDGLFELKVAGKKRACPGEIKVLIGAPVQYNATLSSEDIALDLASRVAALGDGSLS